MKTQAPSAEQATQPIETEEPEPGTRTRTRTTVPGLQQSAIRNPQSAIINHLLPIVIYSLMTVLLTWPVALKLSSEVPGGGDAWQNIWNLWWVKESLVNLHTNPYHTNLLYYPDGVSLYLHTLVLTAGLIGIPLQLLGLNLIATYNLILLSSFVLAGYGAYLLCNYLTGNRMASFVGGIVFAFSPYHFAHMFGHMNLVSLQWMPFYVLLLLKAIDAHGWRTEDGPAGNQSAIRNPQSAIGTSAIRNPQSATVSWRGLLLAIGAGALLAVNAYTDWLYGLFMAMLTGVILAWKLLMPSERRAIAAAGVGWVEAGARLALLGVTFLALTAPILFPTLAEASKGYAQQPPEEILFYSSDLVGAFLPSELNPIWGNAIAHRVDAMPPYLPLKNPSERVVFLGYSVLALSAVGLWRLRRNRHVLLWAFIALLMWLFSLGPILQVAGKSQFTVFKVTVPLPYLLLFKLPLFNIMRTPARLTVLVMLALAILVSFSLASLLSAVRGQGSGVSESAIRNPQSAIRNRRVRNPQFAWVVIASALILFEFFSAPYPMVPPGWNVPIYAKIAQEPGNFALLELPLRPFGDYMAYQTIHGKPIIGGYIARQPPYPLEEQNSAVKYLLDTTSPSDPLQSEVSAGKGVQSLQSLGVKYVIIRWWAFTPEQKADMQAKLNALLARSPDFSYPADQVDVWQLLP